MIAELPSTRFLALTELASLPYFKIDDRGHLVRKPGAYGPVIDCHTHLALAFGKPHLCDLEHKHDETEHYLNCCSAFDLEAYMGHNIKPERMKAVKRDLVLMGFTKGGMRRTHTAPNLLAEMDDLGIEQSLLLPIDFPFWQHNSNAFLAAAERHPSRLVSFGSVHPYGRNPIGLLSDQTKRGARGIKLHPNVQNFRPDFDRPMRLYKECADARAIVFWHCGPVGFEPRLGRYFTQVRFYEKPIRDNPHVTFMLGHSGAMQVDQAIALQQKYKNVYLELSSQGLTSIGNIIAQADPDRLVFGTDWPWFPQAIQLAKVLLQTEHDKQLRHKILHGNAAKLLGLE